MSTTYFPNIDKIQFEGRESDNPLAFKFYEADKVVAGKTMKEHFRFAAAYWHSFCNGNGDPFGLDTRDFPWAKPGADAITVAKYRVEAAFEFFQKIGIDYYCFHDRDIAPEGSSVIESEKILHEIVSLLKQYQQDTGVKLLWGTANLFSHPRYMNGASTNPDFDVLCHGAAQVKAALDATVELGGENYVFWGGREGYMSLLNTDMKRETAHMAEFLRKARDYGRSIGFKGSYLIEPKPAEPSKHQYDFDAATVIGFLKAEGLADDFKLNIEANHATLAGHTFAHDLQVSADAGMLGSIDANQGDYQNGWDTDYFPHDIYDTTETMMILLQNGGIGAGGLNFDAKIRRNSTDPADLFVAHIGGMDTFAQGLLVADKILTSTNYTALRKERYSSYNAGKGAEFEAGKLSLADLRNLAVEAGEPKKLSGKQEQFENLVNQCIGRI
ncbi:xylose isomerase [Flammeovirgaceae bacterium SG7u.111]|nr:xylose isomerase [Flammeovirgaceae bacterium SG7u.132]WPO35974.1 xylose isomerase [Flammeovirgaceae bacterium SG7u.111]